MHSLPLHSKGRKTHIAELRTLSEKIIDSLKRNSELSEEEKSNRIKAEKNKLKKEIQQARYNNY